MGTKISVTAILSFILSQGVAGVLAYYGQTLPGFIVSILAVVGAIVVYFWYRHHIKQLEPVTSASILKDVKRKARIRIILGIAIWILPIITLIGVQGYVWNRYFQIESEKHRPNLAVTTTMVARTIGDNNRVNFRVEISMTNTGDMTAYEMHDKVVIAVVEMLQDVRLVGNAVVGGTIGAGETIVMPIDFAVTSADGSVKPLTKGIALYWDVQYADSLEQKARIFHNEQWAFISEENYSRLAYLPQDTRDVFEVFVRRLLGKSIN